MATHPHRLPDLTKWKLLIIQMARQSPSGAWLEYDLAFRKDAAATGASDWSKMNLDLYNFHLRSPAPIANPQSSTSPPVTVPATRGYISQPPYCISWNNGQCRWPFGECHYRHVCSSSNSYHPRVSCPFHPPGVGRSRFPSPVKGRGGGTERTKSPPASCVHSVNNLVPVSPDQHRGLCGSVAVSSSDSTGLPASSVPVHSFFPLVPVHLESPCSCPSFRQSCVIIQIGRQQPIVLL